MSTTSSTVTLVCGECGRTLLPGETAWRGPRMLTGKCCAPRPAPCEGCGRPVVHVIRWYNRLGHQRGWLDRPRRPGRAVVACSDGCRAIALEHRRRKREDAAERARRAAAEYWATHIRAARTLPCPICGRDFPENYDIRKYCSTACRMRAYRARRKAVSS